MYKLVIVDDEKIIRETISNLIDWETLNIQIVGVCKDGIEAFDCIMDECPDLVMTDIRMPGLTGLDLIEKVRSSNPNIEFIILSGYGEFEYAKTAMEQEVKYYLLKPCNENDISDAVRKAVLSCQKKEQSRISQIIDELFSSEQTDKLLLELQTLGSRIQDIYFFKKALQRILLEASTSTLHPISQYKLQELLPAVKGAQTIEALHRLAQDIETHIFTPRQNAKNSDCVDKVVDYITLHISDPNLSLKAISENYLYMNADYVSKQFVKQTGEKFSSYLAALRVNEAKKLLQSEGSDCIQEVAQKVGFGNNPQYFSQIFKKYTSMTPGAYVKSLEQS